MAVDQPVDLWHGVSFATDDFEVYRDHINRIYYPARLELLDAHDQLHGARASTVRLTDLTLGIVRWGAEVLIDPGDVGGYHVDLPLTGSTDTSCGSRQVVATSSRAAVYVPNEHTFVSRWGADATEISIKIDRAAIGRELSKILGRPVNQRVKFDIAFDMTSAGGRRWVTTLRLLLDTIADPGPMPESAVAAQVAYLERLLIVGLLTSHNHSLSDAMRDDLGGGGTPASVRRVVDLVTARPGAQYTVADLAQAAGVSVRRLQQLFQNRFDMSPSEYVRNVRLDGARADLLRREPDSTVSDIAFRWGFNHLGRFAGYYEDKFGERPSRTLGVRQVPGTHGGQTVSRSG